MLASCSVPFFLSSGFVFHIGIWVNQVGFLLFSRGNRFYVRMRLFVKC